MSEGGLFAWKRQDIKVHRGPAGEYANVHKPLPSPPKGMYWVLNGQTKEWSLEKKDGDFVVAEVVDVMNKGPAFIEHELQKTDTFAGICLRYKITPTEFRQANGGFSGTNLFLAPKPLRIPNTEDSVAAEVAAEVVVVDAINKGPAFIEHVLQKTDTFAGICLRYKITPTEFRRANGGFSGTNLFLAPNPLRIPNPKGNLQTVKATLVEEVTPAQKTNRLMSAFRGMARSEAKCYLELNDWNLEQAKKNAREDGF